MPLHHSLLFLAYLQHLGITFVEFGIPSKTMMLTKGAPLGHLTPVEGSTDPAEAFFPRLQADPQQAAALREPSLVDSQFQVACSRLPEHGVCFREPAVWLVGAGEGAAGDFLFTSPSWGLRSDLCRGPHASPLRSFE